MRPFIDDIEDWEYGVEWKSKLIICDDCGLVSHDPEIRPDQISSLYPSNYLAHTPSSGSNGIYSRLKRMLAERTARKIAGHVPPNGVFLEIGCGNGHLMKVIASVRPDIRFVGVDIEQVPIDGLSNFEFYHGQFEDVDIEAHTADVIYCSNLIEHVPNPIVFASKIARTLKSDGVLLGVTPDHLSLDRYIMGKYWAGYHYPRHTFVFNHKNIVSLLERVEFESVRVKGSYSFWYLSLANRFMHLPGTRKRGISFALVTALFLPFDILVNLVRCHGSMTFFAKAPKSSDGS